MVAEAIRFDQANARSATVEGKAYDRLEAIKKIRNLNYSNFAFPFDTTNISDLATAVEADYQLELWTPQTRQASLEPVPAPISWLPQADRPMIIGSHSVGEADQLPARLAQLIHMLRLCDAERVVTVSTDGDVAGPAISEQIARFAIRRTSRKGQKVLKWAVVDRKTLLEWTESLHSDASFRIACALAGSDYTRGAFGWGLKKLDASGLVGVSDCEVDFILLEADHIF